MLAAMIVVILCGDVIERVLVEYVPTFSPGLNFPRAHCYDTRCYICYSFGRQIAAVMGGNRCKSYQKKENRPRQKDRLSV